MSERLTEEQIQQAVERARQQPRQEGWHVGTHNPKNVWEGERPVCHCETAEDAARIVATMNSHAGLLDLLGTLKACLEAARKPEAEPDIERDRR